MNSKNENLLYQTNKLIDSLKLNNLKSILPEIDSQLTNNSEHKPISIFDKSINVLLDTKTKKFLDGYNDVTTNFLLGGSFLNFDKDETFANVELKKDLLYGTINLSKSISVINKIYAGFTYYPTIFEKIRTKINKRTIKIISQAYSDDINKFLELEDKLKIEINKFLDENGYNSLADLYIKLYMDQIRFGVAYLYFDKVKPIFYTLDQSKLLCLYHQDLHIKRPKLYLQYVDWNNMYSNKEVIGLATFGLARDKFQFNSVLNNQLPLFKFFDANDIMSFSDGSVFTDYDLYVESPVFLNKERINELGRLIKIRRKTNDEQYGNLWFISLRDSLSQVKFSKDFSLDVAKLMISHTQEQSHSFKQIIGKVRIGQRQFVSSSLIENVHFLDKNVPNRELLLREINTLTSEILAYHAMPAKIIDIQNVGAEAGKRNEDVQHIETAEFIQGIINSYDNLLRKICLHCLTNIKDKEINKFLSSTIFYLKEIGYGNLNDLSTTAIIVSSLKSLTLEEKRRDLGLGSYNVNKLVEVKNEIEAAKLLEQKAGMATNQNGQQKSGATSKRN